MILPNIRKEKCKNAIFILKKIGEIGKIIKIAKGDFRRLATTKQYNSEIAKISIAISDVMKYFEFVQGDSEP